RVPEVLDCWFESGSMPFAQMHYPFENRERFEAHFPADYIVEYVAQTRGWFYTLMVLGTALFDRPPFKNCVCHGIIVAQDGRKLSKRLKNYFDPELAFQQYGADALRWRLMASPVLRGLEIKVDDEGRDIAEVVRLVINPIWNAYKFFVMYANVEGYRASFKTDSERLLDRYILAKTRELVENVTQAMDAYDLSGACAHLESFSSALNNWYIRRSRDRFWNSAGGETDTAAFDTLFTVLTTFCKLAAPQLPLLTEAIYRGLTNAESVHLEDWPDPTALPEDHDLVRDMDRVREVCSVAHALRESNDLRARLPLAELKLAGPWAPALEPYAHLVKDELNVKAFVTEPSFEGLGELLLKPDGRKLGPRIGKAMKDVGQAARSGDWTRQDDGTVEIAGQVLQPDEYDIRLMPSEADHMGSVSTQDALVELDIEVTPELEAEGTARDLVRMVQNARKDAGYEVTDRITVTVEAPEAVLAAVRAHETYVVGQVLASSVSYGAPDGADHVGEGKIAGEAVRVGVTRDA
nr:class I tRNA ligase family protein [Planctomycetota bacterium]